MENDAMKLLLIWAQAGEREEVEEEAEDEEGGGKEEVEFLSLLLL